MNTRYSVRIATPRTSRLLIIDNCDDRISAVTKAHRLTGANVHDRHTGNVYVPSLRQWVKASTFATIRGTYGQSKRDKQAEQRMLADLAMWTTEGQSESFSAEGC